MRGMGEEFRLSDCRLLLRKRCDLQATFVDSFDFTLFEKSRACDSRSVRMHDPTAERRETPGEFRRVLRILTEQLAMFRYIPNGSGRAHRS